MIGGPLGSGAARKSHRWNDRGARRPLTDRQHDVLAAIAALTRANGQAPTLRELADHLGIAWRNGVSAHVRTLEAKGWIKYTPGAQRSIVILGRGRARQEVATDQPIRAAEAATPRASGRSVREVRAC